MDDLANTVELLVWMQAHHDMNTLLLVSILKVAHEVSLNASDKLAKLASKTLLSFLEYA